MSGPETHGSTRAVISAVCHRLKVRYTRDFSMISGFRGKQPASDVSRKPSRWLPLPSASAAVTFPATERRTRRPLAGTNIILLGEQRLVCV